MRRARTALGDADWLDWVQATLALTRDPRLQDLCVERLEPGPGARSHLFAASAGRRHYVIKVRRSPGDTAEREAWALRRLRGTIAPRLVAWWPAAKLRDPRMQAGGVLVMARALGEAPDGRRLDLAARTIARLHAHAPSRGPELLCPSSVGSLLRYAADLAARLPSPRRGLTRALRALAARPPRALPSVRALCHGDLRWHNMRARNDRLKLLDLELAGIGDPAVDLALMTARTPLSDREAGALLASYLEHRRDETLRARYAAVLAPVSLVSALSATLASAKGHREELERALARIEVPRRLPKPAGSAR